MWRDIFVGVYFVRIGNFLYFAGTNVCDKDRLVSLDGN